MSRPYLHRTRSCVSVRVPMGKVLGASGARAYLIARRGGVADRYARSTAAAAAWKLAVESADARCSLCPAYGATVASTLALDGDPRILQNRGQRLVASHLGAVSEFDDRVRALRRENPCPDQATPRARARYSPAKGSRPSSRPAQYRSRRSSRPRFSMSWSPTAFRSPASLVG